MVVGWRGVTMRSPHWMTPPHNTGYKQVPENCSILRSKSHPEMSHKSDIIIRRARETDYDDILKIGVQYEGRDYLPYIFKQVLEDSDIYPVVAEVKGLVVGFCMCHVLDGGQSAIRRASRVHPSYRKLGIYHRMAEELDRYLAVDRPDVRYSLRSVTDHTAEKVTEEFSALGYREILRVHLLNLMFEIEDIPICHETETLPEVSALNFDNVKTLFTLDVVLNKFFVPKRMFVSFIGYRCLESNIHRLVGDEKEVYVTTKSHFETTHGTKPWFYDIDVITFSEWWKAEVGHVYFLSMYGAEDYNEASLIAHINTHAKALHKLCHCEKGVLMVFIGGRLCEHTVAKHLKRFGFHKLLPTLEKQGVLFEKQL